MEEVWKDIPNYKFFYQASSFGRIKSISRWVNNFFGKRYVVGRILTPCKVKRKTGNPNYIRLTVQLCRDGETNRQLVSRLIALTFIDNPENKPFVCHKDDNPQNNIVGNLFWGTLQENTADCVAKKRNVFGERCLQAKLNVRDIIEIRKMYAQRLFTHERIAQMYNVQRSAITRVINRTNWNHI